MSFPLQELCSLVAIQESAARSLSSPVGVSVIADLNWLAGLAIVLLGGVVALPLWHASHALARWQCDRKREEAQTELKSERNSTEPNNGRIEELLAKIDAWTPDKGYDERAFIQPMLTGLVERAVFCVLVAIWAPGFGVALFAWIAAKLAAGWGRSKVANASHRAITMAGLQVSLVSIAFGVLAGLATRHWLIPS